MSKICGIYKITSPTGKVYIGQSININQRWTKYRKLLCKNQKKLFNSFVKYGVENHIFSIVENVETEKLNEKEIFYIKKYDSCNQGLNCTVGGNGVGKGKFHPNYNKKGEASKLFGKKRPKQSEKMKGRKLSKEHKEKIKKSLLGHSHSEETKIKIGLKNSINLKGKTRPEISGSKHPRAKKVICTITKKSWRTAKECWEELYKNFFGYSNFKMMLTNKINNKTNIKYV
jgi:group I intron endonuclease